MAKYTEEYLKDNKFDGLYLSGECGCEVGDLEPCGGICEDCKPGYKHEDPREGYKGYWGIWPSTPNKEDWDRIHY